MHREIVWLVCPRLPLCLARMLQKQNGEALFVDMTSRARARYSLSLRLVPESSVSHYEQPQVEQVHYVFELRFPGEVLTTSGKTLGLILGWGPSVS
jgi:hypothetical protein